MPIFKFDELKEMLARGPMTFLFHKKDGAIRTMTATTNPSWMPKEEKLVQRNNSKVITVWDLEKKAFRSVSVDAFICA